MNDLRARLTVARGRPLIGRVGSDARGCALIDGLIREGVHSVHVSVAMRRLQGAAVIQVDDHGQKQILAALGASLQLSIGDIGAAAEAVRAIPLNPVSIASDPFACPHS